MLIVHNGNNRHSPGVQSFEETRAGLPDVRKWRAIMFDQLVSEKTARKPLAVALSLSGQVGLLGLTILFPLMRTAAITPGRLTQYVPVLKPWGRPKPEVRRSPGAPARGKPGMAVFREHVFVAPAVIPSRIELVDDAPSVGMPDDGPVTYGSPDGVYGLAGTEVIPPPKPAPPALVAARNTTTAPPRVRVGGVVQSAKLLRQAKPVYPPFARSARISGVVHLEAVIGRNGTIESLRVIDGHELFVQAALEAVRQWVYQPTLLNGDPVEVLTQIEVNFKLGE
jgi:protein TonB